MGHQGTGAADMRSDVGEPRLTEARMGQVHRGRRRAPGVLGLQVAEYGTLAAEPASQQLDDRTGDRLTARRLGMVVSEDHAGHQQPGQGCEAVQRFR
ncbi:hypothetical protein GCM10022227_49470 [Streptomyces sedi]